MCQTHTSSCLENSVRVNTSGDWRNYVNDDMYLVYYIIQEADETKPHGLF